MSQSKQQTSVIFLILLPIIVAVSFLVKFWGSLSPYPYSDEWTYVWLDQHASLFSRFAWFFERHGEHRIPLQRIIQTVILELSGYNFRATIAFNLIIAVATSILLTFSATNYRGRLSIFDAVIPIIIFSPMAGFLMWGFHLQFLLSVFFFSLIVYLTSTKSENRYALSLAINILLSLCGLNGLILSIVISPILLFKVASNFQKHTSLILAVLYIIALTANILTFQMAGSSQGDFDLDIFASVFGGLLISSLIPESFNQSLWIKGIILIIWCLALGASLIIYMKRKTCENAMMAVFLIAPMLLLLAIAYGRSQYLGVWQPTLAMHYGTLSALIPIAIWLFVSKSNYKIANKLLGSLLIAAYLKADYSALQWRLDFSEKHEIKVNSIMQQIGKREISSDEIILRYTSDFWFTSKETIEIMKQKMPIYRQYYQQ
jgi:hypothetical protein